MRQGLLDAVSLQRMLYDALDQSDDSVLILEQVGSGADGVVVASVNGRGLPRRATAMRTWSAGRSLR